MAKPALSWISQKRNMLLLILSVLSISTAAVLFLRGTLDSCNPDVVAAYSVHRAQIRSPYRTVEKNPLGFMRSKLMLLVSHELSLSGGPLLLMELAFLLRNVGAQVVWFTYQKPAEDNEVTYNLHHKMLDRGVQVLSAKGQEAIDTALKADMIVLNTAVSGKWLDSVLKEHLAQVLPKILWWIHEIRGHYFKLDYVKHLPFVAGAMIDSHTTAEYWKNRTLERLGIHMPKTYVVHLGNSKELMEVAEDSVARRVLREHIRESLGVHNEDLLFAIINSVSRGKGQDLFLQSFSESLRMIHEQKLLVPTIHAVVVGSDMHAQTKFEMELRNIVGKQGLKDRVHFVNKTLTVAPYLAAIDVLVQNSQARGECFGRITIEAMAFQLPVLGTAAGGTTEIVVDGSTGLLHPVGKEGVLSLAKNIVKLATHVEIEMEQSPNLIVRDFTSNYQPSSWDYSFLLSLKTHFPEKGKMTHFEQLKDEVRQILQRRREPEAMLSLINVVNQLGLDNHFAEEINNGLNSVLYEIKEKNFAKNHLHYTSLLFKLRRQYGFHISQDKDVNACFATKFLLTPDNKHIL